MWGLFLRILGGGGCSKGKWRGEDVFKCQSLGKWVLPREEEKRIKRIAFGVGSKDSGRDGPKSLGRSCEP